VSIGQPPELRVGTGEACAISTGAHLPAGADTVVMLEDTSEQPEGRVKVFRAVETGRHVVAIGEELTLGSAVLPAGRRLAEREVAALAAFGVTRVTVFQRARVAILSTGVEVCRVEDQPAVGQVRDVNQHALAAGVEETGALATRAGIASEDPVALAQKLGSLLAEHDLVIVSGGSSVGVKDFTAEAIARLGANLVFHGIDVRPGRPTLAARLGDKVIFGLPGVPAAAVTIFQIWVNPVLRRLQGEATRPLAHVPARLDREIISRPGREDYVRVQLETRGDDTWACPLPGPTSLSALVRADGLIVVPESAGNLQPGIPVQVLLE
jgi:molybdopterin molybdotransferase